MKLGFVSALLHDLPLEKVFETASTLGFGAVELMCWPPGKADRRYAGVTHIDCATLTAEGAQEIRELAASYSVEISGLGYYPNPLDPDAEHRAAISQHLHKVIAAAEMLKVPVVNTFIGRDSWLSVEDNFRQVHDVWAPIIADAEQRKIAIGIEHCPMLFSKNQWPGGKNLAVSPAIWRELFAMFPTKTLGLNFDPSHLVWQFIDCARAVREFGDRIVHVHAKDERLDMDRLYEVGVMGLGWHVPKLPGLGDVKWGEFFAALTDVGYNGPVCVEVEDRAYEGSWDDRVRSLRQSKRFLEQYVV